MRRLEPHPAGMRMLPAHSSYSQLRAEGEKAVPREMAATSFLLATDYKDHPVQP